MSTLFDRIVKLCEEKKITDYALEKGSALTLGTFRKWETSMPAGDKILRVANYLDVSTDYLLGNTQNPKSHKNNPEDCVAAMQELKKAIDNFSTITTEASAKGQSEIDRILTRFHIDPHL